MMIIIITTIAAVVIYMKEDKYIYADITSFFILFYIHYITSYLPYYIAIIIVSTFYHSYYSQYRKIYRKEFTQTSIYTHKISININSLIIFTIHIPVVHFSIFRLLFRKVQLISPFFYYTMKFNMIKLTYN